MEWMGIAGVMVNCALIGQSGQVHRMFPNITGTQTILLIIILEVKRLGLINFVESLNMGLFQHALLVLKNWISYVIPDVPTWVATETAKIEWKRREREKQSGAWFMTPSASLDTVDKSVQTEDEVLDNRLNFILAKSKVTAL